MAGPGPEADFAAAYREELEKHGVKVITAEFSEILKGWGGVHCVTVFLKRG